MQSKNARYEALLPVVREFVQSGDESVSLLANLSALLKEELGYFWVGFYLVKGDELVLGPFQGSPACSRIKRGRGVCGTAWQRGVSIVVPDVEQFAGHIACSSLSRSEIVVPLKSRDGTVTAVLDVDSTLLNDFDETDRIYLEEIARLVSASLKTTIF